MPVGIATKFSLLCTKTIFRNGDQMSGSQLNGFGCDDIEDDLFESKDPAIPSTSNFVTNAQFIPRTCTNLSTLEEKIKS